MMGDSFLSSPQVALSFLPFLAVVYGVSAYIFLAAFGEISWTAHTIALLQRFALLGASIAVGRGLDGGETLLVRAENDRMFSVTLMVFCLNSCYLLYETRNKYIVGPKPATDTSLKDKVVMVTGANTGIGKDTVRQVALLGATVVLACRSEKKARAAIEDICKAEPSISKDQLIFLECDLSDFSSVRQAAKNFPQPTLNVLINNAGVMFSNKALSKDGYEMCLQANHLGHYLLTRLLLPKLKGRVLNLASITYKMATSGFDFEDYNCEKRPYTLFGQYAQSKVCNMLFTKELARRYSNGDNKQQLQVYAVNPGIVRTDVTRNMNAFLKYGHELAGPLCHLYQKTPEQGAYTSVWAATCCNAASGSFLANSSVEEVNDYVQNATGDAKRLWDLSAKLVGWKGEEEFK